MPYSAADVRARETIARVLICGLPKAGKTTCAVLTAPKPVFVFNTDGRGALDPVMLLGGEFAAEDITDFGSYTRAILWLKQNMPKFYDPTKGVRGTVVFDNISTFSGQMHEELKKDFKDGRQLFPELAQRLTRVMRDLLALPMHLVVLGHLKQGEKLSGEATKFLSVPGTGGTAISALMQDWIGLEVSLDPNTNEVKREFLLAPEGSWQAAVRSIRNLKRMPADISAFLELVKQQHLLPDAPLEEETDEAASEETDEAAASEEAESEETAAEAQSDETAASEEEEGEAALDEEEAAAEAEEEAVAPAAARPAPKPAAVKPATRPTVRAAVRAPVRSTTRPTAQRSAAGARSR